MPMLTTFLDGFASVSLPLSRSHAIGEELIWSSTAWTSATTSTPSTISDALLGIRQRDVENRAVLGDIDVFAPEHLVSSFSQIRLVCEFDEESQRLIG